MKVDGEPYRTLWPGADHASVEIIDQTRLPHEFAVVRLATVEDAARAIKDMLVRGAPLIGATAAYGMWLALRRDATDQALRSATTLLLNTRPTAVNLRGALATVQAAVFPLDPPQRAAGCLQPILCAGRRLARCRDHRDAVRCLRHRAGHRRQRRRRPR